MKLRNHVILAIVIKITWRVSPCRCAITCNLLVPEIDPCVTMLRIHCGGGLTGTGIIADNGQQHIIAATIIKIALHRHPYVCAIAITTSTISCEASTPEFASGFAALCRDRDCGLAGAAITAGDHQHIICAISIEIAERICRWVTKHRPSSLINDVLTP